MKTLAAFFLSKLMLVCVAQDSPSLERKSSEISADILNYFQHDSGRTGFVYDIRQYLKNLDAVDFSSSKVVSVKGFLDKKTSTVVLIVYWVGVAKGESLDIIGADVKLSLLKAEDIDTSLEKQPHISKYLGSATYRITESQWNSLLQGSWGKFCVGGGKVGNASMFSFTQDAKGNIKGFNTDNKSPVKKLETSEEKPR